MKRKGFIISSMVLAAILVFAGLAWADWSPGDPAKWVQLPDLTPLGVDVHATSPIILADDFQCTATGPITDIHIWASFLQMPVNPGAIPFTLSIYKDIPKNTGGIPFSRPGELLWTRQVIANQFVYIASPKNFTTSPIQVG